MNELVKIVIPSYQRAGKVTTIKHVINCSLVVRQSEFDQYSACYPDIEIIPIPDDEIQNGIADTREWIMRNVNNGNVFMCDDDLDGFKRTYNPPVYQEFNDPNLIPYDSVEPDVMYEIIQADAHLCKSLGLYLFGLTVNKNTRDCRNHSPYLFNRIFSGGAFGVLRGEPGCKIALPYHEPRVALCEDYYIALINAYYHRCSLINFRIQERSKTFTNVGGLSSVRSTEKEREAFFYLREKFGNAVVLKREGATNSGGLKNNSSPYERSLRIPL